MEPKHAVLYAACLFLLLLAVTYVKARRDARIRRERWGNQ